MLEASSVLGGHLRVRTVSLLLSLVLGLCFATGAYEVYKAWAEHQGRHGPAAQPPPGLPDFSPTVKHRIKLGT